MVFARHRRHSVCVEEQLADPDPDVPPVPDHLKDSLLPSLNIIQVLLFLLTYGKDDDIGDVDDVGQLVNANCKNFDHQRTENFLNQHLHE